MEALGKMRAKPMFDKTTGSDGKIYWKLLAENGDVLMSSRGYSKESEAIDAIGAALRYARHESRFDRRETEQGQYFFRLISPAGRVLGWSEMYHSKHGRDNGIVTIRRIAQLAREESIN